MGIGDNMSSVVISGDSSGTITLSAPSVAGSNTATLPAQTGTVGMIGQGTAVASTSGTSVTFTGIPSWAKQITVMFNGVSTNGTSLPQVQVGSGSVSTSGYATTSSITVNVGTSGVVQATTGFQLTNAGNASYIFSGSLILTLISSNTWVGLGNNTVTTSVFNTVAGVSPTLSGALDRVVITTVNGTDTFDAGSINILYQG